MNIIEYPFDLIVQYVQYILLKQAVYQTDLQTRMRVRSDCWSITTGRRAAQLGITLLGLMRW